MAPTNATVSSPDEKSATEKALRKFLVQSYKHTQQIILKSLSDRKSVQSRILEAYSLFEDGCKSLNETRDGINNFCKMYDALNFALQKTRPVLDEIKNGLKVTDSVESMRHALGIDVEEEVEEDRTRPSTSTAETFAESTAQLHSELLRLTSVEKSKELKASTLEVPGQRQAFIEDSVKTRLKLEENYLESREEIQEKQQQEHEQKQQQENQTVHNKLIKVSGGFIEMYGCKLSFPEGAVEHDTDIEVRLDNNENDFPPNFIAITPILVCRPAMKFRHPVSVELRTCFSASTGEIPVSVLYKNKKSEAWTKHSQVTVGTKNLIRFDVMHFCSRVAGFSEDKVSDGNWHLRNYLYAEKDTLTIASVFLLRSIHEHGEFNRMGYMKQPILDSDIEAKIGDKVKLSLDCTKPEKTEMKHYQGTEFEVTHNLSRLGRHEAHFKPKPSVENYSGFIEMDYSIFVGGNLVKELPIGFKYPIVQATTGDVNITMGDTGNQIAKDNSTLTSSGDGNTNLAK